MQKPFDFTFVNLPLNCFIGQLNVSLILYIHKLKINLDQFSMIGTGQNDLLLCYEIKISVPLNHLIAFAK